MYISTGFVVSQVNDRNDKYLVLLSLSLRVFMSWLRTHLVAYDSDWYWWVPHCQLLGSPPAVSRMRATKLKRIANGHVNHDIHNEYASYFPTLNPAYTSNILRLWKSLLRPQLQCRPLIWALCLRCANNSSYQNCSSYSKAHNTMNRTDIDIIALDSSRPAQMGYLLVSPREMQRSGLVYSLFGKVRDTLTFVRVESRLVILTLRQ